MTAHLFECVVRSVACGCQIQHRRIECLSPLALGTLVPVNNLHNHVYWPHTWHVLQQRTAELTLVREILKEGIIQRQEENGRQGRKGRQGGEARDRQEYKSEFR